MIGTLRLRGAIVLAAMLAIALSVPVQAQEKWPTKPVKVVIPFVAGGLADAIARFALVGLSEKLGHQFYVENRPGAGGAIGAAAVARAEPDGYTLIVSGVGSHITAPLTNPKIGYDPVHDFTHIAMLGGTGNALAVHPTVDVKTFDEFIKKANATPGGLAYASSGQGTLAQMAFEYFRLKHNLNVRVVPYAGGGGAALKDAIGGHLPAIYSWIGDTVRNGQLVGIAVSAPERMAAVPNAPTFRELGYPELDVVPWFALSGPKGLPDSIVQKLNTEVREVLKRPEVKQRMDNLSIVTFDWDVPTVQRYFVTELARWKIVADFVGEKTKN